MSFLQFLQTNLMHVLPILIAAAFAVAIISERVRALFYVYPMQNSKEFFAEIKQLVMSSKTNEAVALCAKYPNKPVAKIAQATLERAHLPESLMQHGVEMALSEASQMIQRRTNFLSTIANVATLLGLFGTIAGLISSFEAVGHADAQQKSALLSAGIATAMNATMMGLAVAIPCMVAFSFLMSRSNRMMAELESGAIHTLDIVKQYYYGGELLEASSKIGEQKPVELRRVS